MRIGVLTLLWRRPRLTEVFLRYWAGLKVPGISFQRIAAIDPNDEQARVRGWKYVESKNQPETLTNRWIAACKALKDVDAALVVGSDDFVNAEYVRAASGLIAGGSKVVVPTSLYFLNADTGHAIRATCSRVGGGRMLSRDVLEATNYAPWTPNAMRCDGAMDDQLVRYEYTRVEGEVILAVKTRVNLWSFRSMMKLGHYDVDTDGLMQTLPGVTEQQLREAA